MKRWIIAPLCLAALLCACGERAVVPVTSESAITEVVTTTEEPTTRVLQPLPEGCRLLSGKEKEELIERLYRGWVSDDEDLYSTLSGTKTLIQRSLSEGNEPALVLRDEATGEKTVIAWGNFRPPTATYKIDDRYILWTEYVRGNDYHGIYDTKRMREITLDAGGYILRMYKGCLYAFQPTNYGQYGPLCLYRTSLNGLDQKEHLKYEKNLLEGLPEADLGERPSIARIGLSPDCRYYAVRAGDMGILIYDLRVPKLALHVAEEAIPDGYWTYDFNFIDDRTVYYYSENEPLAIEIKLP